MSVTLGAFAALAAPPVADPTFASYQQRPGAQVPMTVPFRNSDDRVLNLAEIAHGMPMILVPAYYNCTSLCGLVRASLFGALRRSAGGSIGDYAVAVFSIDPRESSEAARKAKLKDQQSFGPIGGAPPYYLTGNAQNIRAVTDAIGFHYQRDPITGQFLHPAGLVVLTAKGVVSSYLQGVGYTPVEIRAGLQRAEAGRLSPVVVPLLLLCFHFDESTGRYSLEIMKVIRLAGGLTVLTIVGVVALMFRRERKDAVLRS
jgi:protein SCO1/2